MQIATERTHQILAYIDALNRRGIEPTVGMVNAYGNSPDVKRRKVIGIYGGATALANMFGDRTEASETRAAHLSRLSWATIDTPDDEESERRVALTPVGRAVLKALNAPSLDDESSDVFELVLNADDPFAYAHVIGALATSESALLVEPYFRLPQLIDLEELTNVKRVLIGTGVKPGEVVQLSHGLSAIGRHVELRQSADVHDRYLIPAEDSVLMMGISLNGVGRKISTITTLSAPSSVALRQAHERLWDDATPIAPTKEAGPAKPLGDGE